jgi:hypothetical protein
MPLEELARRMLVDARQTTRGDDRKEEREAA